MNRPTPITQRFDRDADAVLGWVHEPSTAPIPMRVVHPAQRVVLPSRNAGTEILPAVLLPVGPTTQPLDLEPETVHRWEISWWMFVLGVTVGMATMAFLLRSM